MILVNNKAILIDGSTVFFSLNWVTKLLKMSLNKHITNWKHVVVDHCLFRHCVHLRFFFFKSSFKRLIFTPTTDHQPTGNPHSSAKTPATCHFGAYLFATCEKIPSHLRVPPLQCNAQNLFMLSATKHSYISFQSPSNFNFMERTSPSDNLEKCIQSLRASQLFYRKIKSKKVWQGNVTRYVTSIHTVCDQNEMNKLNGTTEDDHSPLQNMSMQDQIRKCANCSWVVQW